MPSWSSFGRICTGREELSTDIVKAKAEPTTQCVHRWVVCKQVVHTADKNVALNRLPDVNFVARELANHDLERDNVQTTCMSH